MEFNWRNLFATFLLFTLILLLISTPFQLPKGVGEADFRPYWSSSYLLVHGSDFGNPDQLGYIERTLTGWNKPYIMHSWFAPTGNLIIIPFTFLSFSHAVFWWLILNTIVIVSGSILLWPYNKKHLWVPIVITIGYSMTLASLAVGQINTFEVFGLALFLFFKSKNNNFRAGLSLILTTIKAHLVIITLPLLLLDLIRRKQLRTLAGFLTSSLICTIILFAMYPGWPTSFWNLVTFGMRLTRETPTVNGLLVISGNYTWGRWLWLFFMGIAVVIWAKRGRGLDYRTLIDLTILMGLIVSPVGWSYDQIMLLLPLLRIFEWIKSRALNNKETYLIIATLFIANSFTFYQRSLGISDVWFFWIPILITVIYFYVRNQMNNSPNINMAYLSS